jgi:AcrR family transcriptional regulator
LPKRITLASRSVLDEPTSHSYLPIGMKCPDIMTKVRGRPREFDPDQALAAALRVFWTRGYEGASMAELTEAMGITKPSLYACFGNKEALFRKALDLYERDKLAYISTALEAPTARGVVERLLQGALSTHCGGSDPQGCLGVISMVAGTTEAESIREHVVTRRVSSEEALIDRFVRAKEEGDLPGHSDPKALAQCVTTVLGGLSVKAQGGSCPMEQRAVVDAFLAMWPTA